MSKVGNSYSLTKLGYKAVLTAIREKQAAGCERTVQHALLRSRCRVA